MSKSNLSCKICTKNQYCELLKDIEEIKKKINEEKKQLKELKVIQLPISIDFSSSVIHKHVFCNHDKLIKELRDVEVKQQKCFNSRRYIHTHLPKYICFEDEKYDYQHDPQFTYFYCGKWKEYLLQHPNSNMEELE